MRQPLIAGNWKMHTTRAEAVALASGVRDRSDPAHQAEILLCPPFPYLQAVGECLAGSHVALGAQNMHYEASGAFTGEVSPNMLLDLDCRYVILGHSERRHVFGETEETINRKVLAALGAGLRPILCVGELLAQREAGQTNQILADQLNGDLQRVADEQAAHLVVAYEPVWAIGTGKTATPQQAEEAQAHLRKLLADRYNQQLADRLRILYGGSVKPENAAALLNQPNVDGALVGGASLAVESFVEIVAAAG
jgi:triosephosphate isomerase